MDYLFNQEKNLELYGEEKKKEGKREGIEIGKEQGIDIGKKQEKIEIAKKMKLDHEQIEKIMKYTLSF